MRQRHTRIRLRGRTLIRFRGRVRGLTLIEILIAIVIVSVGIIGVLALVTATLKSSGVIIESSFASTIGRSVYEALRAGARQRSFMVPQGNKYYKGFCFVHDGVVDNWAPSPYNPPVPPQSINPDATLWDGLLKSDFAVFLPSAPAAGATGGAPVEKIFVYPRPSSSDMTKPNLIDETQTKAENTAETDNSFSPPHAGYGDKSTLFDVRRIYMLKNRQVIGGTGGTPTYISQADASDQYGFAFSIRRAAAPDLVDNTGAALAWADPTTGGLDSAGQYPPGIQTTAGTTTKVNFVDGLYQVEVMVYRNFDQFSKATPATPDAHEQGRTHEPVGRFIGLIAIGG